MAILRRLLFLAMLGTLAAIVGGFAGPIHPLFDTLSNFRLHLSVLLVVEAAIWSLKCSRAPAFVFALAGFTGVVACAPGLPFTSLSVQASAGERVYRLFSMNLLWDNPTPETVVTQIKAYDPDLVFLTEYASDWHPRIEVLKSRYPFSYRCAEWEDIGGSIILSRMPIISTHDYCGPFGSLGLTHIEIEGLTVAAGIVHLRWPWPASGPRQIDVVTPELNAIGPDAIVAGDFNSASWTHSVARFARAGGLTNIGGIGPTWGPMFDFGSFHVQLPRQLGLPLDNAMAKGAIAVTSARAGQPAGSDHLPVLVEFVVRPDNDDR